MKRLNMKCVYANDIDKFCREIYKENYGIIPEGDIRKINVKEIPTRLLIHSIIYHYK